MINIKMKGGLGNQLFQYAAARSLALKHGTELNIDISFYNNSGSDTPRAYLLDKVFNINKTSYLQADLVYKTAELLDKILRRLKFRSHLYFQKYYFNLKNNFDLNFEKLPNNSWLTGSFQNEKYFLNSFKELKPELTFKIKPVERDDIKNSEAVFIHIRRGDYLLPQYNHHHIICSLEYYQEAVKMMQSKLVSPRFFIFSDDIAWVRDNLKIAEAVYVSSPSLKDYEELYLMSSCRHAIIANSTFSWWGAYLIDNPSKIIISPQKWFAGDEDNLPDLVPDTWIKI
jgi:hypothetical protein